MAIITDKLIQGHPSGKDQWVSEDAPRGHGRFQVRTTKHGERLFYFRYTGSNGDRVTLPIGAYDPKGRDGLTLAEARAKSGEFSKLYQSGIKDVKEHLELSAKLDAARLLAEQAKLDAERVAHEKEIAEQSNRITVSQLFDRWEKVDLLLRKDKGAEVHRMFHKDVLPLIGSVAAKDVRKAHVTEVVDLLLARGVTRMAKQIFSLIRQMFRYAVDRDIVEVDPTAAIRKKNIGGQDVERDRVLSDEEITLLASRLDTANLAKATEISIWICLSTCCRVGELIQARWEHIDFEKSIWVIPPENSKNGKRHEIFLSSFALDLFKELQILAKASLEKKRKVQPETPALPWVYPNRGGTASVCTKTLTKQIGDRQRQDKKPMAHRAKAKITTSLSLPGGKWTPHDLRRTGATMMVSSGVLPEVAERCLNHTEQDRVKRTYQRYSYETEMKNAWQQLGEEISVLRAIKDNQHNANATIAETAQKAKVQEC